jgi:DNA-binding YbaB/EbfC family protein
MVDFLKRIMGGEDEAGMQVHAIKAGPEIGARMQELHEALDREMSTTEVTGEAGAGMVRVRMSLDGTPKRVEVSPDLYLAEMQEPFEDLVLAALQDAKARSDKETDRIRAAHMEKVGRLMTGLLRGSDEKSSSGGVWATR